jgi:hypothetical protein
MSIAADDFQREHAMRLVPEDNFGRIEFYKTRVGNWIERAAEIGISVETAETLQADVDAAWAAYQAALRARAAAEAATSKMNNAIEKMANTGAAVVSQIRGAAGFADDENIYVLASINPPAKGSPIAPPGRPDWFKASIGGVGELTLTWKCKNPRGSAGTLYKVSRQISVNGPFEFLGVVGEKKFVDETIPPGTATVTYQVQAFRSTKAGPVAEYNVHFGTIGIRSSLQLAA